MLISFVRHRSGARCGVTYNGNGQDEVDFRSVRLRHVLFGSDYAVWHPKWLIEKFIGFTLPDNIQAEYGVDLSQAVKRKIWGENAARFYGIDIASRRAALQQDEIGV